MAYTDLQTAAGARVYLTATAPATEDLAGFVALAYTEIGSVQELGEFGDTYADVTFTPLATRRVLHFKGSVDGSPLTMPIAFDPTDVGQSILDAALASDDPYSVKIVLQDTTTRYLAGRIMSSPLSVGGTDSMVMRTVTIQPSTAVFG